MEKTVDFPNASGRVMFEEERKQNQITHISWRRCSKLLKISSKAEYLRHLCEDNQFLMETVIQLNCLPLEDSQRTAPQSIMW
jgi:hypothetical protein